MLTDYMLFAVHNWRLQEKHGASSIFCTSFLSWTESFKSFMEWTWFCKAVNTQPQLRQPDLKDLNVGQSCQASDEDQNPQSQESDRIYMVKLLRRNHQHLPRQKKNHNITHTAAFACICHSPIVSVSRTSCFKRVTASVMAAFSFFLSSWRVLYSSACKKEGRRWPPASNVSSF